MRQQQQIPNSNKQYSEEENIEPSSLDNWGDDLENVDSLLPSQASWGTSKDDRCDSCPKDLENKNDQVLKEKSLSKSFTNNKSILSIKSQPESSKFQKSLSEAGQSNFCSSNEDFSMTQQNKCDSLTPEFSTGLLHSLNKYLAYT